MSREAKVLGLVLAVLIVLAVLVLAAKVVHLNTLADCQQLAAERHVSQFPVRVNERHQCQIQISDLNGEYPMWITIYPVTADTP
jgi:hypothetical protein